MSDGPVARATPFRPPAGPGGNMERGAWSPGRGRFLACACFLTDNLFVERYGLHLRYHGDPEQLRREYGPVSPGAAAADPSPAVGKGGGRVRLQSPSSVPC